MLDSRAGTPAWPGRFFARLVDTYLAHANSAGWIVGGANARSSLLRSRDVLEFALPVMGAVAAGARAAARFLPNSSP